MPKEELLHVRFEHKEALQSKKDFLISQMYLLKMAGVMEDYNALRDEEFRIKLRVSRRLKELKTAITKLQKTLPNPEIPDNLKKEKEKEEKIEHKSKKGSNHTPDVEEQLREIERRLSRLQGEN
ncbi:MAG: hypothetical protein KKC19_03625 [Nanoarchaeota archaeon]|nr:hypothetical protein [Nanoarchaeota archaeon]